MKWLYRLADRVIDSGPFVTPPAHDPAVLGVVEIFDSTHVNPRTNRITADGTTWRNATAAEIAAFDEAATLAIVRDVSRQKDRIADLLILLKLTTPAGQWNHMSNAERLAAAFALADDWVPLRRLL